MPAAAARPFGFHRFRLIALQVADLAEQLMQRRVGLCVEDSRVIIALHQKPNATASDIGPRILFTPVQVGRCVARLKQAGLLAGERDPRDGRAVRLQLTDKGVLAARAAQEIMLSVQAWAVRELDDNERAMLDQTLDRLMRSSHYDQAMLDALSASLHHPALPQDS